MTSDILVKNDTRSRWLVKIGADQAAVEVFGYVTTAVGLLAGGAGALASIGPISASLSANGVIQVLGISTQVAARAAAVAGTVVGAAGVAAFVLGKVHLGLDTLLKEDGWIELYPGEDHKKRMTLSLWQQCQCLRHYTNNEGELVVETFFMRPIFSGPTHNSTGEHSLKYWLEKNGVNRETYPQNLGKGVASAFGEKAFRNVGTGGVLDGNGENLYMGEQNDGRYQMWTLSPHEDGNFSIMHKCSGKALDGNGANVYFFDDNGGDYQRWKLVHMGDGVYRIHHVQSQLYLCADHQNLAFTHLEDQCTLWKMIDY